MECGHSKEEFVCLRAMTSRLRSQNCKDVSRFEEDVLVATNEIRCSYHGREMFDLSIGQDKAPKAYRILATVGYPRIEIGEHFHGFLVRLSKTRVAYDSIQVIVDKLTKFVYFLLVKMNFSLEKFAHIYVKEIVRLHGIPSSIILDRDPRFTSRFWELLQKAFRTRLLFSTTYHPQTNGQTGRTIHTLEDILRAYVLDQFRSQDSYLPLVEFTYNCSYNASIGIALYEALCGRKYQSLVCWYELGETKLLGPNLVQQTTQQIKIKLIAIQSQQKSYVDKRMKPSEFQKGYHVFLQLTPIIGVGRTLQVNKLSPRYVGPYMILKRVGLVAYQLALPASFGNMHNIFHVSQLRKCKAAPAMCCNRTLYSELL